ncbi:Uncharacterised protein [Providencia rustigianii]|nr:Uncharacterised protein [Providencia rustigianii]
MANTLFRLKKKKGQQQPLIVTPEENDESDNGKGAVQQNSPPLKTPNKRPHGKRRKEPSAHRSRRVVKKHVNKPEN